MPSQSAGFSLTIDQAQLLALRRRLKSAGDKGLVRELNKGLRAAAEPVAKDARAAAAGLPSSRSLEQGTLRRGLAAGVTVSVTTTDRNPGVRIRERGPLSRASNARRWRHPVFGRRSTWVSQTLAPGWFRAVAVKHRPEVARQVHLAVERVARQISRGH